MVELNEDVTYRSQSDAGLYVEYWDDDWILGIASPGITTEHRIPKRLAEEIVEDHLEPDPEDP